VDLKSGIPGFGKETPFMDGGPLLGKEEGIPSAVPREKIAPFPVIKIIVNRLVASTDTG
jgi:hypothetical protein